MILTSPLEEVPGVGPALAKKLAELKLASVADLINYYPRRYDDFSLLTPINKLKPGTVTIQAVIKQAKGHYARRGLHITEAVASDDSGSVRLVWFNQPYRAKALKTGESYYLSGVFELSHQKMAIMNPACELVSSFPVNTARILPIYRETKGLTSNQLRKIMKNVVPLIRRMKETLPAWLVAEQSLVSRAEAIESIHFPVNAAALERAQARLAFEEVFELSLAALISKQELSKQKALSIPFKQDLARDFVKHLPFTLTDDQRRVIWQIYQDLDAKEPMNRLVEGDVGSGKTVVATMAAVMAMAQGYQVAFMAPTALLAEQHADTIHRLLEPLGLANQLSLLTGAMKAPQKKAAHEAIKKGQVRFIVGTHALIQEKVDMHKLGLVVIDEQHRFGVRQRQRLQQKAGHMPHLLSMTATPIPRSLALTLYGELDVSLIMTKPALRRPIITKLSPPSSRTELYNAVDEQLAAGRQVFVVCPLVSDSYAMKDTVSAEAMYETLRKGPFRHRRVGLLHGQMKAAEKTAVMERFVRHELDVLVSTTVIEVGVDVPNASTMLIENPERFGLAQLHQLRGRVGRSDQQGYCYLMLADSQAPSRRLRAIEGTTDGFKLAELDLELRGPGAIYGTMQHGELDLRLAKLTDIRLLTRVRQAAESFLLRNTDLLQYKHLAGRVERLRAVTNLN